MSTNAGLNTNLYNILGVSSEAELKEIHAAHRKLAMKYHPDRNGGDTEAIKKFKEMQAAYDVLADPKNRAEYDRSLLNDASSAEWARSFWDAWRAAEAREREEHDRARREAEERARAERDRARRAAEERARADKEKRAGASVEAKRLLSNGRALEALDVLREYGAHDAATKDLEGVCLMRLGRHREAVELYRSLVLEGNGIILKKKAPLFHKLNYATSLLMEDNVEGCMLVLAELHDIRDAYLDQLRSCVRQRSFLNRICNRICNWLRLLRTPSESPTTIFTPGVF